MSVNIWEEQVIIPTYEIGKPNKNAMFFEKRVYQGSSGVVYPNAIVEKISDVKTDKAYTGLFIENEYLKIMILPELGGRIQMAYDKIRDRHFIYYNQVIKPALVGLTGPWISGGIEFNWPQHHRPSTFEPIDYTIEENSDGSKTVWVNEIEKMFHTKGMAGFTLHPGKAYIEIKAKLLNRSDLPQTFLWWANPAVKVNDHYQSVFPPDVNAVFDHGKRDVSSFPIATGKYYKVDYSPGTDISMYKNIPVPTSYMAINSNYDFVGGYEHDSEAGLLHVANHHVSPGKKQWTWGHGDFGIAWDRNLTDEDGPYIELMTGMFTDNQPDFTWLMPNEEKSFTQYFLPYRELGVLKNASKDILLSTQLIGNKMLLKVFVTSSQVDLNIKVSQGTRTYYEDRFSLSPSEIYIKRFDVDETFLEEEQLVVITSSGGRELLRYQPANDLKKEIPAPAKPALQPEEIKSVEQLFLTGQHLEQYRHATYSPVPYYEKALEYELGDIRSNNALGLWYLRRGQFAKSEPYFLKAIETSTERNPNPYDGEPYYNLGVCLSYQGRQKEAYKAFYKATWSKTWKDNGFFCVGQLDLADGEFVLALEHLKQSLDCNANNSKVYVLISAAYRHLGQFQEAINIADLGLQRDVFNLGALYEKVCSYKALEEEVPVLELESRISKLSRGTAHNLIEYANDYAKAGLYAEAIELLKYSIADRKVDQILDQQVDPLVAYYLGYYYNKIGDLSNSTTWFKEGGKADSYLCFPNRLEDILVLQMALELYPQDAKAAYYLGNLFYDKRQYKEAIDYWESSAASDSSFPAVLRNLGIAYFNKMGDHQKALDFLEQAFALDPDDDRICMELHQLYKRLNYSPEERLTFLQKNRNTALNRDDLYLELVAIYNFLNDHERALELIVNRQFHPWEGGEGKASGQYVYSLLHLAKRFIMDEDYTKAISLLLQAQEYPHNLGEGKLYGTQENDNFYWMGCAYEGSGDVIMASEFFKKATQGLDEPSAAMFYNDQQPDKIFYQGLAWRKLHKDQEAVRVFEKLIDYGTAHLNDHIQLDYFAVSLPNLLIFEDDLDAANQAHCYYLQGLGLFGLEKPELAKEAFIKTLKLDAEHQGAKSHLDWVQSQLINH
jgi:tetratricopeptide (TPR) repeat protein